MVIDNTIYAYFNGVYWEIEFDQDLIDGMIFYNRKRNTIAKSSILEHVRKAIVPADMSKIKPFRQIFSNPGTLFKEVTAVNDALEKKGLFRVDEHMTSKGGYLHLFHSSGMIKIKIRSNDLFKISSSLVLKLNQNVDILNNVDYSGVRFYEAPYKVTAYTKKRKQNSFVADRVYPKTIGTFVKETLQVKYGSENFNVSINESGTVLESTNTVEIYNTGLI